MNGSSTLQTERPPRTAAGRSGGARHPTAKGRRHPLARFLVAQGALLGSGLALVLLADTFDDGAGGQLPAVAVAPLLALTAILSLFWVADCIVDVLPGGWAPRLRPYVYAAPALLLALTFLVYPVISTIFLSFRDADGTGFVGGDNYNFVLSDPAMLRSLRNTAAWIVVVPVMSVAVGLGIATLTNRLRRGEAAAKAAIFMPTAISFVGAAVIWNLVYDWRPEGFGEQVGLLNGIKTALGGEPVPWKQDMPWNNLFLMVILVWGQAGLATVVLSSAVKGVPGDLLDAARVDGASEWRVFRHVIVPVIKPTILVVSATILILTLKVFEVVFVMTNGEAGTEVIAERMITWFFRFDHDGRGAAIAVFLFLAAVPIVAADIRRARREGMA